MLIAAIGLWVSCGLALYGWWLRESILYPHVTGPLRWWDYPIALVSCLALGPLGLSVFVALTLADSWLEPPD